tara:strand:+ start:158 stop:502 length:345 start_codon:yes stop_codon:yes gene_type:complete
MNDLLDIGDEVICKDAFIKPENSVAVSKNFTVWIKQDAKYIVRDVFRNDDIVVGIVLQDRRNPDIYIPLLKRMQEPAFAFWRFEKLRGALEVLEEKEEEKVKEIMNQKIQKLER